MTERWVDKAHVSGGSDEEREAKRKEYEGKAIEAPDKIAEFEKTDSERQLVLLTAEAYSKMCADFGLPTFAFSEERVHVAGPEYFANVESDIERPRHLHGYWDDGHVYVQRQEDPVVELSVLSHEIGHAVAHFALDVRKIDSADGSAYSYGLRKSGLQFIARGKDGPSALFAGLNEATTELVAFQVREEIAQRRGLDEAQTERIMDGLDYKPALFVLDALLDRLAASGKWGADEFGLILRDYVTGSSAFFKRIEKEMPGSVKHLASMDTTDASALAAAKALGLNQVAARIEEMMETSGEI